MVKSSKVILAAAAGVAVWQLRQPAFLPPARHMALPAAGAVALTGVSPAFADEIGDAAKALAGATYDFAKEVDWNNGLYLQAPGKFQPLEAIKAIDKMIVLGAQADPKLLKAAADAHHKAIGSISGPNGVTSKADWEAVNAALGRVFASVPESTVMDVYNSVSGITDAGVPTYLKSLVNGADAEKAYSAFLTFKDVVKKNQVASAGPAASAPSGDKIGEAAKKLSDASYPFLKDIDWTSDLFNKPLPGASVSQVLKAVDKTIVMGSAMDGNLLKAAAEAHHKAIGSIDGKGLTSAADYEAVNAALGRVIASVPTSKVMDVYNAYAGLLSGAVPNKLFSSVDALNANAAAKAFYEFKDVVKAAQR
jgi:hypothetical protein